MTVGRWRLWVVSRASASSRRAGRSEYVTGHATGKSIGCRAYRLVR